MGTLITGILFFTVNKTFGKAEGSGAPELHVEAA
jgi:hypothetical protein